MNEILTLLHNTVLFVENTIIASFGLQVLL